VRFLFLLNDLYVNGWQVDLAFPYLGFAWLAHVSRPALFGNGIPGSLATGYAGG
jgi:hypothetical protein